MITLDQNDGSVDPVKLSADRTTSYSFRAWNTEADGSGVNYTAGGVYTTEADVTLYAQWNSETRTAAVLLPIPSREGYDFKGWSADREAAEGLIGEFTPDNDITLYALWDAHTYSVSYDANGGTISDTVSYGQIPVTSGGETTWVDADGTVDKIFDPYQTQN